MHSSYFHREEPDSSLRERMVFIPFMGGKPLTSSVHSGCVWPRSGCLCLGGGGGGAANLFITGVLTSFLEFWYTV